MPVTLAIPAPAAGMSASPALTLLARIVEETRLDDGLRVDGDLVPVPHGRGRRQLLTTALAGVLHERYFRGRVGRPPTSTPGRPGDAFCRRLADALHPEFLQRDGWCFACRTAASTPSFVITGGGGPAGGGAASCFLDLRPGTAPEVFARLVTMVDGYGLGFRAELAGDPAGCTGADAAVVTVARREAGTLARIALRLQQRVPFAFAPAAPGFTRQLAPGVALADEPGSGTPFGRHRCGLVAEGLVAAGPGAAPAQRRAAVLRGLREACLDPTAPHLNPGSREFEVID
jgi:hypothetical protein